MRITVAIAAAYIALVFTMVHGPLTAVLTTVAK